VAEKSKKLTPFEKFAARQIAEFPTLYRCSSDVICRCILDSQGECYWDKGVLKQSDQNFNTKTKAYERYPLRMPLKTAAELHQYKLPSVSWSIGGAQAPISKLPTNADKSYLEAISTFLFIWSKLTEEDWAILSTAYCLTMYQRQENQNAPKKLPDYLRFMRFIPKWTAQIRAVQYFQMNGEVDPRTFQGIDI
jgi:hypothetical protein